MFKIRLKGELGSTDRAAIIVKTVHNFEFTANEALRRSTATMLGGGWRRAVGCNTSRSPAAGSAVVWG